NAVFDALPVAGAVQLLRPPRAALRQRQHGTLRCHRDRCNYLTLDRRSPTKEPHPDAGPHWAVNPWPGRTAIRREDHSAAPLHLHGALPIHNAVFDALPVAGAVQLLRPPRAALRQRQHGTLRCHRDRCNCLTLDRRSPTKELRGIVETVSYFFSNRAQYAG